MLFVHTPVPPGRDMQASEDLFMDVDEPPSKRSRETPSSTQRSDVANPDEFVQRAQAIRASSGDPCSASATWKRCTSDTTVVSQRRSDAFDATISMFSRRRDSAREPRVWKTRNLLSLHHPQFLCHIRCPAHLQFHPRCPRILLLRTPTQILLLHTFSVPTQSDESDKESAVETVETQSDDPF